MKIRKSRVDVSWLPLASEINYHTQQLKTTQMYYLKSLEASIPAVKMSAGLRFCYRLQGRIMLLHFEAARGYLYSLPCGLFPSSKLPKWHLQSPLSSDPCQVSFYSDPLIKPPAIVSSPHSLI